MRRRTVAWPEALVGAESYPKAQPGRPSGPRKLALALPGLVLAAGLPLLACRTIPVTGRSSFNIFSPSDDVEIGREAYDQALAGQAIAGPGPEREMVERVMSRLVDVADDEGWEWQVTLIEDDEVVNAFALPGGKMAVYTGILAVCESPAGLAVVIGHELGHVVGRHGTERVTQAMGVEAALGLLDAGDTQAIVANAYHLLVGLPFGRQMEAEADHIGLIYMARAGYDPREAIAFWERMERGSGSGPPEFLSTHPSHETRIRRLEELLPEALAAWNGP